MGSTAPLQLASFLHGRGYRLGPRLGKGSYAKVKVAERIIDGYMCAVKIVNRKRAAKEFLERFLPRELSILVSLDHKNVIKVFEVIQTHDMVCVVMEYAGSGDLLDFVKRRGYLAETTAGPIFAQVCEGIRYLHSLNICHRDLKCENILLRRDLTIALSDFGFSRTLPGPEAFSQTYCGSAAYASPELLRGKPYLPLLNDVWSLGCVLFILVTGQMPFYDKNTKKMMYRQLKGKVNFPEHRSVSPLCREVIGRALEPNTTLRCDIKVMLEHPWLSPYTKTPSPPEQHQDHEQCGLDSVDGATLGKKIMITPGSSNGTDIHQEPKSLNKIKETLSTDVEIPKDTIPRESSRLSHCSMDSEEDRTTSGTTEVRSLCRIPGKACILRVLRHTTAVLSRIEDPGSENEHVGAERQGSGSSVDSATSYLLSSSTCVDSAPTMSPPLQQQSEHPKAGSSSQRDSVLPSNKTPESKADRNFKMNIQKILQIPKKMSARLLTSELPRSERSNDSLSDASSQGTGVDASKTSATSLRSDPGVVEDFKHTQSTSVDETDTSVARIISEKETNGPQCLSHSYPTTYTNGSCSSPLHSEQQTAIATPPQTNSTNKQQRSLQRKNSPSCYENSQQPLSRKRTPSLASPEKTRIQQEGLVRQMRRIFESKDAGTSTDQIPGTHDRTNRFQ